MMDTLDRFMVLVLVIAGVAVGLGISETRYAKAEDASMHMSQVHYPGEEAAAKKACGKHRVLYWWLEDPRKSGAMMHARCAGQIKVDVEVKF